MIRLDQKIQPLIMISNPALNTFKIQEHIAEYLENEQGANYDNGFVVPSVHVSGLNNEHATALAHYLNRHNVTPEPCVVVKGYFGRDHYVPHSWIQAGTIIIDITIKQFKNFPQLPEELAQAFSDFTYFIADDQNSALYALYLEEI